MSTRRPIRKAPSRQPTVFDTKIAKRLFDTFRTVSIDGDALREEVEKLHSKRIAKDLVKKVSPSRLRAAATREQAVRSRIVGIQLEIDRVVSPLDTMRDATVYQLMANYQSKIPVKNATDQRAYLRSGLNARLPWLDDVMRAKEAARYVVEDIDKAAWNMRLIATTFELNTRPDL